MDGRRGRSRIKEDRRLIPRRDPPRLVLWLATLIAPPDAREAFLGDLLEEAGARTSQGSFRAAAWLWSQVIRSTGPWMAYRLPRSRIARNIFAPLIGVSAAMTYMFIVNTDPILRAVRSLDAPVDVVVATGLNLGAVMLGGWAAARVVSSRPFLAAGQTALLALLIPVLVFRVHSGHWCCIPDLVWLLSAVGVSGLGAKCALEWPVL